MVTRMPFGNRQPTTEAGCSGSAALLRAPVPKQLLFLLGRGLRCEEQGLFREQWPPMRGPGSIANYGQRSAWASYHHAGPTRRPDSSKEHPGFPVFYQPGRESEFGACLPVVQYSTVQYCSLYYSRLHEKKTLKKRSPAFITSMFIWYCFWLLIQK